MCKRLVRNIATQPGSLHSFYSITLKLNRCIINQTKSTNICECNYEFGKAPEVYSFLFFSRTDWTTISTLWSHRKIWYLRTGIKAFKNKMNMRVKSNRMCTTLKCEGGYINPELKINFAEKKIILIITNCLVLQWILKLLIFQFNLVKVRVPNLGITKIFLTE